MVFSLQNPFLVTELFCLQCRRPRFHPWVRKIPWRRKWQPTPVFLPGECYGQRSLAGYSSWGRKELDTTEWITLHFQGRDGWTYGCLTNVINFSSLWDQFPLVGSYGAERSIVPLPAFPDAAPRCGHGAETKWKRVLRCLYGAVLCLNSRLFPPNSCPLAISMLPHQTLTAIEDLMSGHHLSTFKLEWI